MICTCIKNHKGHARHAGVNGKELRPQVAYQPVAWTKPRRWNHKIHHTKVSIPRKSGKKRKTAHQSSVFERDEGVEIWIGLMPNIRCFARRRPMFQMIALCQPWRNGTSKPTAKDFYFKIRLAQRSRANVGCKLKVFWFWFSFAPVRFNVKKVAFTSTQRNHAPMSSNAIPTKDCDMSQPPHGLHLPRTTGQIVVPEMPGKTVRLANYIGNLPDNR